MKAKVKVEKKPPVSRVAVAEYLEELGNMLTDRISDLHGVRGAQGERHNFILYRTYIWKAIRDLRSCKDES